ncbi:MAG: DUF4344 domain-containing metallopeptidase [Phormidesmis sp.]
MKRQIVLKVIGYALVGLWLSIGLFSGIAQSQTQQQTTTTPSFTVTYTTAETGRGQEIQGLMQRTQSMERLLSGVNQILFLPEPLTVNQQECGMVNAYYSPVDRQIVMCYELVDYFLNLYASQNDPSAPPAEVSTAGALAFVLWHEIGHALVDILDVPVLGREEDAADQFSTVLLARTDVGHAAAQAAAIWFYVGSGQQDYTNIPYWDEHSLDLQRFYSIVCLLYGSSPNNYAGLMQELNIPERRQAMCETEYAETWENWKEIIGPYVRVPS